MYKIATNNVQQTANTIEKAFELADLYGGTLVKQGLMTKSEKEKFFIYKCVNKQLEPYRITYSQVKKGGTHEYINGEIWYQHYKMQDFEAWKTYCIDLHKLLFRSSKKTANQIFDELNLTWGLCLICS